MMIIALVQKERRHKMIETIAKWMIYAGFMLLFGGIVLVMLDI